MSFVQDSLICHIEIIPKIQPKPDQTTEIPTNSSRLIEAHLRWHALDSMGVDGLQGDDKVIGDKKKVASPQCVRCVDH